MRTDAGLVHEILSHLIANSATYTPRGGTITLSGRALPGGTVELAVGDTGPGIAGDEIHGITERFARGRDRGGPAGRGPGARRGDGPGGAPRRPPDRGGGARRQGAAGAARGARARDRAARGGPQPGASGRAMRLAPGARNTSRPASIRRRRVSSNPAAA